MSDAEKRVYRFVKRSCLVCCRKCEAENVLTVVLSAFTNCAVVFILMCKQIQKLQNSKCESGKLFS